MSSGSNNPVPPSAPSAPSASPVPWGVWFTLALTLVIAVACATVVWYRFVVTPETNCIIAVIGDEVYDENVVEVTPKVAADPDHARLSVTLSEDNQYDARFFLTSGTYQVRVLRPNGTMVIDITDFIPPGRRWTYDLTRDRSTGDGPRPATRPSTTR